MLRLLQWLVFGHIHKWKILEKVVLKKTYEGRVGSTGDRYILQCECCGDIKARDII